MHHNRFQHLLKIVITGTESTGKTTLVQALAQHFQTVWVPEYARRYIAELVRPYQEADLLQIAKGQLQHEDALSNRATNGLLFCDTDLLTIKIWSQDKFGRCHPWILEQISLRKYDYYLLCNPDVPWEYDEQREDPYRRAALHATYLNELKKNGTPWAEITGIGEERLKNAIKIVSSFTQQYQ